MRVIFFIPVALIFSIFIEAQEKYPEVKPLEIGSEAPDFNLKAVDGKFYSLEDFRTNDLFVILFTCNHCPTAQAYEDKFIAIVNKYSKKNIGFVAISPNSNSALSLAECGYSDLDDSYESMVIRAQNKNYNFPFLFDGDDHQVSLKYGPQVTPHAFVFDKDRKLVYRGRIDDTENPYIEPESADLINALDALLLGKDPPVAKTKTFGCSVKWPWKNEWTEQLKKNWDEEEVSLTSISADQVSELMKNKTDDLILLNVWATWCGPCIIEFPELVKIYRMYSGREFNLVSISVDKMSSIDRANKFLIEKNAAFTNYIYNQEDIYSLIEIVDKEWQGSIPYTLLIKPGGEIVYKANGAINSLEVRKAIIKELGRYYADN